ncbi:hypothetical protein ACQKM2_21980 [Streptomyces sp. NPDC004126]|uniref:hypothetical protein n=1 Tax=Streptomyces sp. NPDC004126 TaxID=3390695 RepID=UPI003CFCB1C1
MTKPLPRPTPPARQMEGQPEVIVSGSYGQPSPALMARANRGWRKLGACHGRIADDVLGVDFPDVSQERVVAEAGLSPELLDRARVGWERFLGSAMEAPGE